MKGKMLVRPSFTWAGLWRWMGLLLIVVLLVSGSAVGAREPEPTQMPIPALDRLVVGEEVRLPAKPNPKLDSALNQLLEVQRRDGMAGARVFAEMRQMVLEGDRVQVILVTEPATIPGLARAVEEAGGQVQGDYEGLLQALVPIKALAPLAARPDVQLIRDPWRAIELEVPEAGSVTSEGVAASNAGAWHSAGDDGSGVRVAVVDGSFAGYSGLLGSDLPSSVGTYDWTGTGMGTSVHGAACAEIVHDMAPGATMDLHRVSTVVEVGQAVNQAIADGVDVISMSIGWLLDGPGDGTGDLANIVHTARSNGIFYAAAAGNYAEVTWAGTYDDYYLSENDLHLHAWDGVSKWYNFMGPGTGQCYVFPAGTQIVAGLHWDDWSAVDQDYDLLLARWPGSGGLIVVASSTNPQNGSPGQTPEEYISFPAAGGNCYAWIVRRVSSTRDVCFRLTAPNMGHLDKWTTARSVGFPADSPDAIAVGAVDVSSPYALESYSSQGPTFGPGGVCSGGATKPDLAAYANVSTVSYGPGNFAGTSPASPHVAGAATLVKQRNPGYTVTQVQTYLESEALDLGTGGKDNQYGSGRLYLPGEANTPPTLSGLPDQSLPVNTSRDNAIDLWAYAADAEDADADLAFTISNSPDPNAGVSIDSNRYIDINPVVDWTGTTEVEIQVEDTGGLADTDTFQVAVVVNAPPTLSGLPDQTLPVNTSRDNAIDLWAYAADAEDADADLAFTISNSPDPNAGVSIDSNRYIDINPVLDWSGTTDVEIQVEDTGGLADTDTFQVAVVVNAPPTLSGLPDQTLPVSTSLDNAIDLWAYAADAEDADADLAFTISNSPDPNAGVSIDSNRYIDINPVLDWTGTTDVEIQVEDTGGLTDTDTFQVVVTPGPLPDHWLYLPIVLRNHLPTSEPPPAPELYPIFNPGEDGNYTVSWSAVSGAASYTLEEDDNGAFSSPETVYSGPATFTDITNQGLGTYFYRVKASNVAGDSGWSNVESVTVSVVPLSAPELYPISNPDEDGSYTVAWSAVGGAASYTLEEDDNGAFSSPETVYSGPATFTDITNQGLGTYFYRVKASNAAGDSGWSNVESVTVSVVPLSAPELYPISNPDEDGNYTVAWSAVSGATSYTLEEDDNGTFSSPDAVYSGPATSTAITDQPPGTYFYRVKASNAGGDSDWSNVESVTVTTTPTCLPQAGSWSGTRSSSFTVTSDCKVRDFTIRVPFGTTTCRLSSVQDIPIGDVGQYASLALDAHGHPHIGYYDYSNGDLRYATSDGSVWSITTVDSGGTVGQYTSLALDASGNPHISYYDATNRDLKYARWTGSTWDIQTIDSSGSVGYYTSLALDGAGKAYISYYDSSNSDLKYARWTGSAWDIQTVDSTGTVGLYTSLALDSADNAHLSYYDSSNSALKYARWTGSTWDIQTIDSAGTVGSYTSLALDGAGNAHISYYDGTNSALKYTRWTGSTWDIQTVDSAGTVGSYTSLALDTSENPHISYYDATNRDLKYAAWTGSTWDLQTADSSGDQGSYSSLALDSDDHPHIAYHDAIEGDLRYAHWTGSAWSQEAVDSILSDHFALSDLNTITGTFETATHLTGTYYVFYCGGTIIIPASQGTWTADWVSAAIPAEPPSAVGESEEEIAAWMRLREALPLDQDGRGPSGSRWLHSVYLPAGE